MEFTRNCHTPPPTPYREGSSVSLWSPSPFGGDISLLSEVEIGKTVRIYREYIECRFNTYKASEECDRDKLVQDFAQKADYVNVLGLLKLTKASPPSFCLAYRVAESVEGILTGSVVEENIHVGCLITAPWNLRMVAPNIEGKTATPGIGRALMQAAYGRAQEVGAPKVCLSPLRGSVEFYRKIGMEEDETTGEMAFPVTEALPPLLFPPPF